MDIDDGDALETIRKIKPKRYEYIDNKKRTSQCVYGFIAQEVKEVLDYAVSTNTDPVPNMYEFATVSTDIITFRMFDTSTLLKDDSGTWLKKLRFMSREDNPEYVDILEIIDEHTLKVNRDLTEYCSSYDASGNIIKETDASGNITYPGNTLFVYGQEVDDFHTLNKDAIWTVATAALQEVDRQLQAEKEKTSRLEATIESILARLTLLEQR